MRKLLVVYFAVCSLVLAGCSNMSQSTNNTTMAKHKVIFKLPKSQKWDLVSVEQDSNGFAKSYRSASARGLSADQSFYINYGRNIRTPLLESMHEVVGSMASTGCKRTSSKIIKLEDSTLIFSAYADQCMSGRPVWQIFKVYNMDDGQYSIVYSENPAAVSTRTKDQMKAVVMKSKIVTI